MPSRPSTLALALTCALAPLALAQPDDPTHPPGGAPHRVHALEHVRVIPRPGVVLDDTVIIIRDGVIEDLGATAVIPPDARRWDLRGRTVYAGLIEPYWLQAAPEDDPHGARHTNPAVRPEHDLTHHPMADADASAVLRRAGFTAALAVPRAGVFRGQSALVTLGDGPLRERVVRAQIAQHLAFEAGGWDSGWSYPRSLMGAMALTRQVLHDARHLSVARRIYARNPMGQARPPADASLEALEPVVRREQPVCLEAGDAQMLLRGARLLREFDLTPWVVTGASDEYRWLDPIANTGVFVISSLNFPPAPRWDGPGGDLAVETEALRHWWLSRDTPARLESAGIRFALTTQGVEPRRDWRARVRQAIERGLSEDAALSAFTTAPAAVLGTPQLGVIAPGAIANLTITDGDLFARTTLLESVWIDGTPYELLDPLPSPNELAGTWELARDAAPTLTLELERKDGTWFATFPDTDAEAEEADPEEDTEGRARHEARVWRDRVQVELPADAWGEDAGLIQFRVRGRHATGTWSTGQLRADLHGARQPRDDDDDFETPLVLARPAWPPLPEAAPETVLIRDAVLWTEGETGILRGDLLVAGGTIAAIGSGLEAPEGAWVFDAEGRHVTPGIVDCHSHAFLQGGVNEFTRSCTAEVRIADVVDAETVRIYQQLAGGVTTSNLLHGSANAIGGQNAVVQLRWGEPAHALLFTNAPGGIKFALGENPKRSNWGDSAPDRYPESRGGVQAVIAERFEAALAYREELRRWRESPDATRIPPRRDLQLEALVEIINGRRLVHAHSYRGDEILALLRLAERFGFRVATFQHVLEGYKVREQLAAHGAGASTFSDWWAYKFEVYDAIAYNAALMWEAGVNVSINSDDHEMARRLNQEAAKAVLYGGVPEAEALAMVTRNPAEQLGIGDRVGTLEVGKQADFVVWSDHPLSMTAICEQTWIEGRRYFDRDRDAHTHALSMEERAQLLRAARAAWDDGPDRWHPTFATPDHRAYHCMEEDH